MSVTSPTLINPSRRFAKSAMMAGAVTVSGIALAACGVQSSDSTSTSPTTQESGMVETGNSSAGNSSSAGKTTLAEAHYTTPAGEEDILFTVVVDDNGVITEAQTEVRGKTPTTIIRQTSFAKELPSVIVGKKLSDMDHVDRVGGSSLTTAAFNQALDSLKSQL